MAVEFSRPNTNLQLPTRNQTREDRPAAQVWMNIGYTAKVVVGKDETTGHDIIEERFISLPQGLPLDTMELLSTRSSNQLFGKQQAARNELLTQIQEEAKSLDGGEFMYVNLLVQVRRVNADTEIKSEDNELTLDNDSKKALFTRVA